MLSTRQSVDCMNLLIGSFFFNMNYAINECIFKNKMIFVSIVGQGLTITNVNIANTTVLLTVVSSYDVICII